MIITWWGGIADTPSALNGVIIAKSTGGQRRRSTGNPTPRISNCFSLKWRTCFYKSFVVAFVQSTSTLKSVNAMMVAARAPLALVEQVLERLFQRTSQQHSINRRANASLAATGGREWRINLKLEGADASWIFADMSEL